MFTRSIYKYFPAFLEKETYLSIRDDDSSRKEDHLVSPPNPLAREYAGKTMFGNFLARLTNSS